MSSMQSPGRSLTAQEHGDSVKKLGHVSENQVDWCVMILYPSRLGLCLRTQGLFQCVDEC